MQKIINFISKSNLINKKEESKVLKRENEKKKKINNENKEVVDIIFGCFYPS